MANRNRSYTPEFKARAIDTCLRAVMFGWSVKRFARISRIPRVTILSWLQEDDATFDTYTRAMKSKALELPAMANDIIKRVIDGRLEWASEMNAEGHIEKTLVRRYIEPKAAAVVLRHIEFRVQREIKHIYEYSRTVNNKTTVEEMSDTEIERRYAELEKKARAGRADEFEGENVFPIKRES